jgi:O-6-methylguanine DNA methyltransferase
MNTQECVYSHVRKIPKGKVTTYKALALLCDTSPRVVGKILHHNPNGSKTPCHRVVRSDCTIASGYAFGGPGIQREMLEKEGVKFEKNKVATHSFTSAIGSSVK